MNLNQEEVLFALALATPADKRSAFLEAVCQADPTLRASLESLLEAHENPVSLLETPTCLDDTSGGPDLSVAGNSGCEVPPDAAIGRMVDRYKLLERLGEGGWGVVYVAEQTEPVRRRVALKLVKPGLDTQALVARFEAERQALAMMDHPNIARVFDAGATENGRPYFVMELVLGIPITRYCDQHRLPTRERLELFIQVCRAIQHAHQKGIIHRDIKPSNILVTLHDGVPVPKVIDFGIAKAVPHLRECLTEATVYTQLHQFIGTPAYMSPEQAEMSGLDIDTRSDIYSLGVLLYELLTGTTPFDARQLMSMGLDALRRTIREQEPLRPSTRLTQSSAIQPAVGGIPRSEIDSDLDWIVMKCLEKDRTRRYETANGLAADLKRYLNHEPVVARPPSAAYRFRKTVRRHRFVFAAGALVAAALSLGIGVSTALAVWAFREKEAAQVAAVHYQAALHFLQDVLREAVPGYQPDRDLTVSALLGRIAHRLDRSEGQPPLVEAAIRQTLGSVHADLGESIDAVRQYERAIDLQRRELGEADPETLRSLHGLAMACWWGGDMAQAAPLTRQGLEISRRVLGNRNPLTLQFMQAHAFTKMCLAEEPWAVVEGRFSEALAHHREAMAADDPRILRLAYGLALGHAADYRLEPALARLEEAFALARDNRATEDHERLSVGLMALLAHFHLGLNQLDRAEDLATGASDSRRRVLGDEHPLTLSSLVVLAQVHLARGARERADEVTRRILELGGQIPIQQSPFLAWQMADLGWAYFEQGDSAAAGDLLELARRVLELRAAANPLASLGIRIRVGAFFLARHRNAEADVLLHEAHRQAERCWPPSGFRSYVTSLRGASLARQAHSPSEFAEAERLLLEGHHGLLQHHPTMPAGLNPGRRLLESHGWLIELYEAWGRPTEAEQWRRRLAGLPRAVLREP